MHQRHQQGMKLVSGKIMNCSSYTSSCKKTWFYDNSVMIADTTVHVYLHVAKMNCTNLLAAPFQ